MNLISLFISSMLMQNIILSRFLGICPFIGTSKNEKNALNMGLSVLLVITLSSIITYLIYYHVLIPTNTVYLKTIMFILVIGILVQLLEIVLKHKFKNIYKTMGIYLPLITTNCAVLGTTLLNINSNFNFIEMLTFSLGSSFGFIIIIYVFASIRERLDTCNIPKPFKGIPIAFITAAIMALIFARYTFM